jgi:hypothetical protein
VTSTPSPKLRTGSVVHRKGSAKAKTGLVPTKDIAATDRAQLFLQSRPHEPTCMSPDVHGWLKRIRTEAWEETGKTPGYHAFNYMLSQVGVRPHGYMFNRQVGDGSPGFWRGRVEAALDYAAGLKSPSAEMEAFSVLLAGELVEVAA